MDLLRPFRHKTYLVHSMFATLQGEGAWMGRRAVFVRFTGCNVWSGHEADRERDAARNSACAAICDTQFAGVRPELAGGKYSLELLVARVLSLWGKKHRDQLFVVFTGGEPGLQLDETLVDALHEVSAYVAVETNGSVRLPTNMDWVALSPKFPMRIVVDHVDEVKVLYPLFMDDIFRIIEDKRFAHVPKWVQPVDDKDPKKNDENLGACLAFVTTYPMFRLGAQQQKTWQVP